MRTTRTKKTTKTSDLSVVGLISDTHGLLRDAARDALAGSDLIIHAGDVGDPAILDRLRTIAPITAVRGNIDTESWASKLPRAATIQASRTRIYVLHDLKELGPGEAAGCQIVVTGHSHKPASEERNGVLYINPGSAGPRRFHLPITVARLNLAKSPWAVEFIELSL